ncbi:hypothetical protein CEP51_002717 [Fusarium floridanum]|uniref:Uncharacterized protein n=1 Tax=Fusarium floridanum TaxID=1325733 RepID=A0A428SA01_9HYPO|nr:hypothetical protein CEP51_002717 [Fusarium floridanum]
MEATPAASSLPLASILAQRDFSGVSWAFSEQPNMIHEISKWPAANPSDSIEIQVPTVYDIDSGKWGYQVTRDMEPVKWFKWLLLSDEDLAMEEISRSKQLREARNQLSNHPTQLTATHLVGRYLEKLWDHTCAMVKTMMPIDDFPLRVAITIPANWPDYAQNAMREAAQLAGITTKRPIWASTLDLVQESIAASLPIIQEHSLLAEVKPGECFVVCDAGGGTVDVISFKSEVYGFFSKSLTGIRTLISNQREQVKKETGKFPKVLL